MYQKCGWIQNMAIQAETHIQLTHWAVEPVDWQMSDSSEQGAFV